MLLFGVLAAMAATTTSVAKPYRDVQVGTGTLRVPFPSGYCLPDGERAARFAELAEGDHRNVTLLTLVDCKRHTASNRYLLVKTPISALNLPPLDRADTIKELSVAVGEPDVAADLRSMPQKVGADKSAQTGVQTSVVGNFGPRGHDDVCVYMGGSLATTKLGKTQKQAGGTCVTVVGGRIMGLNAYEDTTDAQEYRRLFPQLRLWALKIRPAP